MKYEITIVSGGNVFSGNAARILYLNKYLGNKMIFSSPKQKIKNAFFTHFSNRILAIKEKSIMMLFDESKIIHCFKPLPTSGIPSLIGKLKGKKLIVDWDDFEGFGGFADFDPFPYNYIADFFEKFIIKKADILTVVSPFLEAAARKFGFDKQIFFIPNGADVENIKYHFNESEGRLKLIFTGLLYKSCDLDLVLKSMVYLDDMDLIVVGDGPRRKEFEYLAKKLGLKNVNFVGMKSREEVKEYLYRSDIALLPYPDNIANKSRYPIKLGEYLAAGKPVVTNKVGVMPLIIENGKNGILTKDDPESFAEGIRKLENEKLRRKISIEARKTAEKNSWKNIAKKLKNVYIQSI
ncbi:MAG: glycosyltransferase family 4 protein [Candidatus Aenigmatarchaeota archaeon]